MSEALYDFGGLRFWSPDEIEVREMFQSRVVSVVRSALLGMNAAWRFHRTEGPLLCPRASVSDAYTDRDIFVTNHVAGGEALCLRPETTVSSYLVARRLGGRLPLCVWQSGKSFRRELNDGASAAKLRFNEFWQLEFQCIYPLSTKADYRAGLIPAVVAEVERFTMAPCRVVPSDRLPQYSESTIDIECEMGGKWREVASCSIRNDYSDDARVCEIALGLDRIATIAMTPGRLVELKEELGE